MSPTEGTTIEEPVSIANGIGDVVSRWKTPDKKVPLQSRIDALNHEGLIGPRFPDERFENSDRGIEAKNPDAWKDIRSWTTFGSNLYIEGPAGTGKSFAARCILFRGCYFGRTVAEITSRNLIRLAQEFEPSDLFKSLMVADILLIDDIDKSNWNPSKIEAVWSVLHSRWEYERKTIVTSNVPFDALTKLMSESVGQNKSLVRATMDRLKPLQIVKMLGESNR